ncbi:MAG: hypothetical protein H0X62_00525 [Bacteroidetes bacterium]|nr:hypothetical protein [Bacteroidota bacterium]
MVFEDDEDFLTELILDFVFELGFLLLDAPLELLPVLGLTLDDEVVLFDDEPVVLDAPLEALPVLDFVLDDEPVVLDAPLEALPVLVFDLDAEPVVLDAPLDEPVVLDAPLEALPVLVFTRDAEPVLDAPFEVLPTLDFVREAGPDDLVVLFVEPATGFLVNFEALLLFGVLLFFEVDVFIPLFFLVNYFIL